MSFLIQLVEKEDLDQLVNNSFMSKLILSLEDENSSLFSKQYLSLPELCDEIENRLEELKLMDKRKRKELKQAKEDVNFLIDMYNAKAKFKTYNRVK